MFLLRGWSDSKALQWRALRVRLVLLAVAGLWATTAMAVGQTAGKSADHAAPPGATTVAKPATKQSGSSEAGKQEAGLPQVGADGGPATTAMPLKITLTPSETPLKIGSTSNIAATIENISSRPVRVELNMLQLTTHTIVAGSSSRCALAIAPNYNASFGPEATLQPQDQVSVLFNLSQAFEYGPSAIAAMAKANATASTPVASETPEAKAQREKQAMIDAKQTATDAEKACSAGMWGSVKRAIDFSPGSYDYFLSGFFSLCLYPEAKSPDPSCYLPMRSLSVKATFTVGIDQTSIIVFAVVGGLLALLVVTFNNSTTPGSVMASFGAAPSTAGGLLGFWQRLSSSQGFAAVIKFLIHSVGAAILSASFTIVSSRLSDTQLPVKITILDAWGAMTVGFVSYFVGQKFIRALANWGGGADDKAVTPKS